MYGHKWFLKLGEISDISVLNMSATANELLDCRYSFYQGVDHKGQAQSSVHISDITLSFQGLPNSDIIDWGMNSSKYLNAVLVLYDANDMPLTKIFLKHTACIGMTISYLNTGSSSIITQLQLQPHQFSVDDETFSQPWIGTDTSSSNTKSATKNQSMTLVQPIGKTSLSMTLNDTSYALEHFRVSFSQSVDHKGQPQTETNGGIVRFSIATAPDKQLHKWMTSHGMVKDGWFIFDKGGFESSPLKIEFIEAYCVNMSTHTSAHGGVETDYIISANEMKLNGKRIYNHFNL